MSSRFRFESDFLSHVCENSDTRFIRGLYEPVLVFVRPRFMVFAVACDERACVSFPGSWEGGFTPLCIRIEILTQTLSPNLRAD